MTTGRLLAEGKDTAVACRELGVAEATYHRWRDQFGGLKAEDAEGLEDLEREDSTVTRLLADAELGRPRPGTPGGRTFTISSRCWGSVNGSLAG